MKSVFWLRYYGCIFHGIGNSAQLCQNFGISGRVGGWTPQILPRYATALIHLSYMQGSRINVSDIFLQGTHFKIQTGQTIFKFNGFPQALQVTQRYYKLGYDSILRHPFQFAVYQSQGTRWRCWFRHCATSRFDSRSCHWNFLFT
jgi:hypothetical protein